MVPEKSKLNQISTHGSVIANPARFVFRYGHAIRSYLAALLRNADDAEEVLQEFCVKVSSNAFAHVTIEKGRFRDYLKVAVRNTALSYLQRKQASQKRHRRLEEELDAESPAADADWLSGWRQCVLDRAWRDLEAHERSSPRGNCFHTVVRVATDHPELDSSALAALVAERTGRPLRPDAFRKQLSNARRMFAELVVAEVARTLEAPTAARVEEELVDAGLLHHVRDFLPADWRERGFTQASDEPVNQVPTSRDSPGNGDAR